MPTRDSAPIGSPCWTDLWTSDVEGSRKFYRDLFGWEAQDPSPEFGGYFMFTRKGIPIAGGMGDMGDMPANDTWKIYLDTDDLAKTIAAAEASGSASPGSVIINTSAVEAIMKPVSAGSILLAASCAWAGRLAKAAQQSAARAERDFRMMWARRVWWEECARWLSKDFGRGGFG